ncbi:ABC transporter ATP-binding protein [Alphaproteobacteria bacterium]|nr:ABC transporter ATP-binding protein [Alphaproteobacteria bacterium]MDC1066523.1 ABC transporter ATP-binding protein [Alphaproteobacteria bacterium]
MSDKSNLLRAEGINKSFGAVIAAKDININIQKGERVSLIGSNGAGKTTFMNMVTGYLKPDSGNIFFKDENITPLNPRIITQKGISRSFQIPQIFEPMSAWENLLVALGTSKTNHSYFRNARSKENSDYIDEILSRFSLNEFAHRQVSELPGGVRKLLDIAMALVRKPDILLLDEPTSGVGAEEKYPLMDTIAKALSVENLTVIFVEHDMDIVQNYSERVIAFYQGEIIADGNCDKVLNDKNVQEYVTGKTQVKAK